MEKRIAKAAENGISAELIDSVLRADPRYLQLLEIRRAVAANIEELEKLAKPGVEIKALTEKKKELALKEKDISDYAEKQTPAIEKGSRTTVSCAKNTNWC